jgi:hypothetical protein
MYRERDREVRWNGGEMPHHDEACFSSEMGYLWSSGALRAAGASSDPLVSIAVTLY